ncbi:hypothetical protein ON010_g8294 [Phytophthora cinnamomi]|nr:hypothetical protein ON010_g8294 [Phytophthora cinnamomi]
MFTTLQRPEAQPGSNPSHVAGVGFSFSANRRACITALAYEKMASPPPSSNSGAQLRTPGAGAFLDSPRSSEHDALAAPRRPPRRRAAAARHAPGGATARAAGQQARLRALRGHLPRAVPRRRAVPPRGREQCHELLPDLRRRGPGRRASGGRGAAAGRQDAQAAEALDDRPLARRTVQPLLHRAAAGARLLRQRRACGRAPYYLRAAEVNFVTLATPHLGIRRPRRGATNVVFNALMPKIFSRTGAQLTLIDEASEETQALSNTSRVFMDKDFHPAWSDVKGPLLVSLPGAGKTHHDQEAFELYDCALSDRKLQIFAIKEDGIADKLKFEVDLSCAEVKVLLPNGKKTGDDASYYSSFIGWGQDGDDEKTDEFGDFDIQIRWTVESSGTALIDTNLCVLRIPEEDINRDWRWLVALSNTSFGVRCVTSGEIAKKKKHGDSSTPPLLSCLTRGQFMQALQMFKVRTLYSSIFFDVQVPYTCAAVRAFNPYRLSGREFLMSPIYTHIAFDSLKSARKLRDTIPLKVKRLALKYMTPNHAAAASPSNDEGQLNSGQDIESSGISNASSTPTSSRSTRRHASDPGRKSSSHSSDSGRRRHHFRHRGKTVGSAPSKHSVGTRPEPFVEGDVILDQLPYAFTADVEQDELRGMLLSVQSVGWRRIDVLFGGIFSHEHIIAKRANPDKPLESGIDVVHHVMDTFLL